MSRKNRHGVMLWLRLVKAWVVDEAECVRGVWRMFLWRLGVTGCAECRLREGHKMDCGMQWR